MSFLLQLSEYQGLRDTAVAGRVVTLAEQEARSAAVCLNVGRRNKVSELVLSFLQRAVLGGVVSALVRGQLAARMYF